MIPSVSVLAERTALAMKQGGLKPLDVDRRTAAGLGQDPMSTNGMTAKVIAGERHLTDEKLVAFARALGVTVSWLVGDDGGAPAGRVYNSLPGWAAAAAIEIERDRVRPYIIEAAGQSPVFVEPEVVTPDFVLEVATLWLRYAPEPVRKVAAAKDAERGRSSS